MAFLSIEAWKGTAYNGKYDAPGLDGDATDVSNRSSLPVLTERTIPVTDMGFRRQLQSGQARRPVQRSRTNTGDFDLEQQIMITSFCALSSSLR
jgi:hypothetical protein